RSTLHPAAPRDDLDARHRLHALRRRRRGAGARPPARARGGGRARLRASRDRRRAWAGPGTRPPEPLRARAAAAADGRTLAYQAPAFDDGPAYDEPGLSGEMIFAGRIIVPSVSGLHISSGPNRDHK